MTNKTLSLAVFIGCLAMSSSVFAAQPNGCSLGGAAMAFGSYDPTVATPLDSLGSLVYRCSQKDHNIMITLSQGSGTAFATRRMVQGSDQLFYNLYLDAARTVIWGDGTGGTQAFIVRNPQGNNQDLTVPIFGRIPPVQNVGVGSYSDTITVTLTF
jgi:spore coat protein U-like protein